ncbi:hypothetical protein [uncultured Gemmiger sp.]|uniref:hypothetical protein n=1 Tax=uncultured Gemmiger sp. TaxID=1623490 RepID=UPI0025D0E9A0|nr:hypothetical protein [uncultured Gemmiger sp.]
MRKFVSAALALCLAGAMTACAGGTTSTSSTEESSSSETVTSSDSTTEEPASGETASGEVLSYDEYMAAAVDAPVTIQAYVQAKQSYYAEQGTATVYLQDQDGAYFAYDMACTQEEYDAMTEGTKIQVSGFKAEWSGEIEIMDGQLDEILTDDTFVAEPMDVTDLLGTDELESHQNEKVSFTGLTVAPSPVKDDDTEYAFLYNDDGSGTQGDDLYFKVEYNGQTYTFTVESYLCDSSTDVYKAVENLEVGQTIDCEGFLYWYEGVNPHITSVTVVG